mmetsp:Transcript_6036/g.10248  ORF Transcript_6036/g.10248 Transcript_6036/m.10248 type:complete len:117 (+) Transcript_6036:236-586(+)
MVQQEGLMGQGGQLDVLELDEESPYDLGLKEVHQIQNIPIISERDKEGGKSERLTARSNKVQPSKGGPGSQSKIQLMMGSRAMKLVLCLCCVILIVMVVVTIVFLGGASESEMEVE